MATITKPPDFIYLQWYGEDIEHLHEDEPEPAGEITWCHDIIWDTDIKYIRYDLLTERMKNELEGEDTMPVIDVAERLRTLSE